MARPINRLAKWLLALVLVFVSFGFIAPTTMLAAPTDRANESYTCLYYKVKRGDMLSRIGARYGVTVKTLMAVNGLRSTRILIGQTLCIPRNNPPQPQPQPGPWTADYWNNADQLPPVALHTSVSAINFNWGWGSPSPIINADFWSAAYTRWMNFTAGTYRFTLIAEGGLRVWVDSQVVFDRFGNVGRQEQQIDVPIQGGSHLVRVDFSDRGGLSSVSVSYVRVNVPGPGPKPCPECPPADRNGPWDTYFYWGTNPSGQWVYHTVYGSLNFDWGWNAPAPGLGNTNWSAQFIQPRGLRRGTYRFVTRSDDGVRIWVRNLSGSFNQQVINEWQVQSARTVTRDIVLPADDTYYITVEYFQAAGVASLMVYWEFLGP